MHAQANILVVDDSPENLQVISAVLKQDYRVKVAINGERALALATAAEPPDLILLDVMMPGMDGYEVCARLKQNPVTARIPVLFVSSRDDEEDEARGLSLGAIDYIVKPIRPSIVQARVRNHIELKRSRDLLEQLTTQDHLTGISNRRRFDDSLAQEWQRAAREQTPLSLVAIDIDHFKAYNDHYGHPQGDQCLIRVARALATCVTRPTDLVARCGGEEFAGLLPSTDSTGAARLAGQMRAAIEAEGLEHARSPTHPHVTISLGVATVVPQAEESAQLLVDLADAALYEAKGAGRNAFVARSR
ncbi:MAG: diguanylate cyclase domain-containing protein [Nitrospirota bacterium]